MTPIALVNIIVLIIGFIFGMIYCIGYEKIVIKNKEAYSKIGKSIFNKYIPVKYILIQVLTGIIFLVMFNALNPFAYANDNNINLFKSKMLLALFFPLYLTITYFIVMIDIYQKRIDKRTLSYGMAVVAVNIVVDYMVNTVEYTMGNVDIYIPILYITVLILFAITQMIMYQKNNKMNYTIDVLIYVYIMALVMGTRVMLLSIPVISIVYLIKSIIMEKTNTLNIFDILKMKEIKINKRKVSKKGLKEKKLGEKEVVEERINIAITPIISIVTYTIYIYGLYYINYLK
ncbi:MAG: hypothetical protein HG467_002275 [Clostridiales bacterium]|nr:hypothetical protein [Clostridiales bacterium]